MSEELNKNVINGDMEDSALRPLTLDDYCGQTKVKNNIKVFVESAKIRDCALDHLLFYGPPGTGKTTIANIIANEMGADIKTTSGPIMNKPADLVSLLISLNEKDVLFIDEIHRMPILVEETLYSAMEDFAIDITIPDGGQDKTIRIDLPKFTLIGATTKAGSISSPLRDRFGSINRLELYTPDELAGIVTRDAALLGIKITPEGAYEIAKRSRGTPRIAIRLLKRVLDFTIVAKRDTIDKDIADSSLTSLSIDENGFDSNDIRIMKAIHTSFSDGPVGVETLASLIGEDVVTIEDVCEPYLMQEGYLAKTPRGRILTQKGINYISKQ